MVPSVAASYSCFTASGGIPGTACICESKVSVSLPDCQTFRHVVSQSVSGDIPGTACIYQSVFHIVSQSDGVSVIQSAVGHLHMSVRSSVGQSGSQSGRHPYTNSLCQSVFRIVSQTVSKGIPATICLCQAIFQIVGQSVSGAMLGNTSICQSAYVNPSAIGEIPATVCIR